MKYQRYTIDRNAAASEPADSPDRNNRRPSMTIWPWYEMSVGETFLAHKVFWNNLRLCMWSINGRHPEMEFSIERLKSGHARVRRIR